MIKSYDVLFLKGTDMVHYRDGAQSQFRSDFPERDFSILLDLRKDFEVDVRMYHFNLLLYLLIIFEIYLYILWI